MKNAMRLGFNINGQRIGDDWPYFYDFFGKLKPAWALVMSDIKTDRKLYEVCEGETNVIRRDYSELDGSQWKKMSPRDYANQLMTGDNHIWRYVLNEPHARGAEIPVLYNWLADAASILADNGYKAIVGNLPVGSFEISELESGGMDRYIRVMGELSQAGVAHMGFHEYSSFLLPFGVGLRKEAPDSELLVGFDRWDLLDPNLVSEDMWATRELLPDPYATYQGNYYYILRDTWFDVRADKIGAERSNKLMTEAGWDRNTDLTQGANHIFEAMNKRYGVSNGKNQLRGAYSLTNIWKAWWPELTAAQAIMAQYEWLMSVYPDDHLGILPFMWSFGDEWDRDGFNYGADRELHQLMLQYAASINDDDPDDDDNGGPIIIDDDLSPEPNNDKYDILAFMKGDGRIYDVEYNWGGGGVERMQTQHTNNRRFFGVKNNQWEELWNAKWSDGTEFIWRGTDTSPGNDELYTPRDNGFYGERWCPRYMSIGQWHFSAPEVTFRDKTDGYIARDTEGKLKQFVFPHWIKLHTYHEQYTFQNGKTLDHVIEVHGYTDNNNAPNELFEKAWYAFEYGLVGWYGTGVGTSQFQRDVHGGTSLVREQIHWLTLPEINDIPEENNDDVITIDDPRWQKAYVSSTAQSTRVRQDANTDSAIVGHIFNKTAALIIPDAIVDTVGTWMPIRINATPSINGDPFVDGDFSIFGWIRIDVITYTIAEDTPIEQSTLDIHIVYDSENSIHNSLVEIIKLAGNSLSEQSGTFTIIET